MGKKALPGSLFKFISLHSGTYIGRGMKGRPNAIINHDRMTKEWKDWEAFWLSLIAKQQKC